MRNWAGNVEYSTQTVCRPGSLSELQDVVAGAGRVKALGSGHSFNPIIDTDGLLISTSDLGLQLEIDDDAQVAVVPGSTTYADLGRELHARGGALRNLGSLPHISVAGACATGTHGSGVANGCLASAVVGVELVTADGGLLTARAGDPDFPGLVLSLGALGVVTRLWLRTQPTYDVVQDVLLDVPSARVVEDGVEMLSSAWSVSLFTSFQTSGRLDTMWRKQRVGDDPLDDRTWGALSAEAAIHPIRGLDASAATEQLGRPGPWHERLPHFRASFTPSVGEEVQSEFFVPLTALGEVWPALEAASPGFVGALHVLELRAVAPDDLWLSPFRDEPSLAVHSTWSDDLSRTLPALAVLEDTLAPWQPRSHWGKASTRWSADHVAATAPGLPRFTELAERLDPDGCFVNDHLRRLGVR